MNIVLDRIDTNFDIESNRCWVGAFAGIFPDGRAVITIQPLRLTGSDIFYSVHTFFSNDKGKSWQGPVEQNNLKRQPYHNNMEIVVSGLIPEYHKASGKMLLTGHTVIYENDEIMPDPRPGHTAYCIWDDEKNVLNDFKVLELPESDSTFFNCGPGTSQRVDLDDGTILQPIQYLTRKDAEDSWGNCYSSTVLHCSFDGKEMKYLNHGNSLSIEEPRGLYEPSLICFNGKYFMTLRNDFKGYVSSSKDGLNFDSPKVWCFDDGQEIGNYCTQQHWFRLGDKLYLVYTRRGANNDHVFRHRAPLFTAEVDTEKLCLIRNTEKIVVPERGARLGNFNCVQVSDDEAWVVVAEWMQNGKGREGVERCMKYGSDNSIFIAKLYS